MMWTRCGAGVGMEGGRGEVGHKIIVECTVEVCTISGDLVCWLACSN